MRHHSIISTCFSSHKLTFIVFQKFYANGGIQVLSKTPGNFPRKARLLPLQIGFIHCVQHENNFNEAGCVYFEKLPLTNQI